MNEYPTDEQLDKIKNWDFENLKGLIEYVFNLWEYPDYCKKKGKKITLVTGGWSGNEDIICALEENHIFWAMCWQASYRGGKYIFKFPDIKEN